MKKIVLSIFIFCSWISITMAQQIRVATYNIRQKNNHDIGNMWDERKDAVANLIKFHGFEIFGIQEAFIDQVKDLQDRLPEFQSIGVGRDDGAQQGEHSSIFYNKNRFQAIKSGTFWLSATDTEHPNKGWDAALPRICTWGVFKDKSSGKSFIFMNTHFDHVGVEARKESAKLILAKAKELAKNLPLILTGDFNVDEHNEAYFTLANSKTVVDSYTVSPHVYEPSSSFNGWGESIKPKGRIDHIFVVPKIKVLDYGILTDTYQGKFPSDHFPVFVELSL
ncbi:endonuclease/exonuclease/phosphatase family protein [Sphingobacterium sp. SRCM116780]|uniref:endonuclease/exonuclease/phosphatase family protein n=1 Tax=Sphingobacterium sp. SRCM116780 TaxID=2907623 RepID=UPI001F409582|nr:endonuclease/exonuclease/phosphatase family protein [Sphingobacterium sp. SRCM116780]UIR56163.1 endonuclease/exonuclease/phosphatase family protein [Sphingobacterium sp. SRCM116780]